MMIPTALCEYVLDTLLFIELSDKSVLNEDAAVAQLESAATTLQRLNPADRNDLIKHFQFRAKADCDPVRKKCIESLAHTVGLG
jgi:hypothetical protein